MNKNLSIIILLASAVIAGIVFSANRGTLSDSDLLQAAVENKFSLTTQTIEYEGGLEVDVDYSDVSNVLAIGTLSTSDGQAYAEYIDASDNRIYVRLLPAAVGADLTQEVGIDFTDLPADVIDRWVYINDSDLEQESGSLLFDTFFDSSVPIESIEELSATTRGVFLALGASLQGISTVHGEVPEGNFTDNQADELLDAYNDLGLYTVLSEGEQLEQDGRNLRRLELELNTQAASELNALVEGFTGQESSFANFLGANSDFTITIDEDTQRFFEYFGADGVTQLRTDTAHGFDYSEELPTDATDIREL